MIPEETISMTGRKLELRAAAAAVLLALLCAANPAAAQACVAAGQWALPADAGVQDIAPERLFADLARRRVVLLGEVHDDPDHHRWQLQTIAGLYAAHPRLALGMEMFPRRVQQVLDQWVAGELSEAELLERSEWRTVWGHDAQLYLPILHFARINRVPVIALNVDRSLNRKVGEKGWAQVPRAEREGVSDPAPAGPEYTGLLWEAFRQHAHGGRSEAGPGPGRNDPAFQRFVESMLVWDRAMAQRIAERVQRDDGVLLVALMGTGHLQDGHGVPRQLADLGVGDAAVLLPWDSSSGCEAVTPQLAQALFGIEPRDDPDETRQRPRLGILLDQQPGEVRVQEVVDGSIAQQAGLRQDDVIQSIAGQRVAEARDVIGAVERQAPGTWLPIVVRRGAQTLEVIARFPPDARK
jgi:uncharacterized iron-regulated protein